MKKPIKNHLGSLGLSLASVLVVTAGVLVMHTLVTPHRHFEMIFGVRDIPYLASNVTPQERTTIQPVVDRTIQRLEEIVVADAFAGCNDAVCDLHRKKYNEARRLADRWTFDFRGRTP